MDVTGRVQHHDDIVYELLFTVLEDMVEVRQEITEQELDEIILELGRQLLVESIIFDNHTVILPE